MQLCQKAGLVKLGHIAIDGTKIKANASKHKAMSYERMGEAEKKLQDEIQKLLAQAEHVDAEEDAERQGAPWRRVAEGAEAPRRSTRKIREAKAALEQEAGELRPRRPRCREN